jgi:hypothetical protein
MATNYPGALDTTTQLPNTRQDDTDSKTAADLGLTTTVGAHATDHNNLADAVIAIEAELGTLPKGPYATDVRNRFEIFAYKGQSCGCATVSNFASTYANGTAGVGATLTATATGASTIDGTALTAGMRVLVKNQTAPLQNGIYAVTTAGATGVATVLTRHYDADTPAKLADCKVLVDGGTVNQDTEWMQSSTAATIGTTAIYFRRTQPIYGHGNPRSPWAPGQTWPTSAQPVMETLPRTMVGSTLTPTSGTAFQYLIGGIVVPAGRTVTNFNSIYTNAGSSISVNWWALARISDRVVMGHSANSTTLPSTNVVTSRALVTPWTPIEDTPVWIVWSINGNTAPAIVTSLAGNAAANLVAPAMCATNGVAPSTTVPTDASTVITAATTGITTIPYVWLT